MTRVQTWFADTAQMFGWAPPWLASSLLIALAIIVAIAIHAVVVQIVRRAIS